MAVRLFVGNLPFSVTEAELREHFSAVGAVSYIKLATDRESGKPRGFAFVEYSERQQAEEAIRRFHNQPFKGRPLAVNEARPRETGYRAPDGARPPSSFSSSPSSAPSAQRATDWTPSSPPAEGDRPARNFGADAPPRRSHNKQKGGGKSERPPKGPMREVVKGRFFGGDDEDWDDTEAFDEMEGENFASRVSDEDEDDDQGQA